jgi:hypothetical protein
MRERIAMLVVAAAAGCNAANAEQPKSDTAQGAPKSTAQPAKAKIDPKADELLRRMAKSLTGMKALQFDANHVLEAVTNDGEVLQFVAQSRVAVQRPNKARSDRLGPVADATFYYDGKTLTIFGKRTNMFATEKAPDNLDAALDFARDRLDLEAPAADLVYSDVYAGLMTDVSSGTYVGKEPIGDRMCHHLAYRAKATDWQIWVEDSPAALPCRYVIRSKDVKGTPTFEVAFSNWQVNPTFPASHFEFKPPANAVQIGFLRGKADQTQDPERKSL